MSKNYILIDFENVQPKNLELLVGHPFDVYVFVGATQTKVSFELASAMQLLGDNAKYIKISSTGRNALDFHIAYYLGEFVTKDQDGEYHVISRDTGFDPLIEHLRDKKIKVKRRKDLAEIPPLRQVPEASEDDKIKAIMKNLKDRGTSRPRKVKTLKNTLNHLFTTKLDDPELDRLIKELEKKQVINIKQGNVTYKLPR